ncbi:hypothetical protein AGMMS49531_05400 [Endomicrobiia bacterium]|nr:hypothetical protein AGMMS49531_05400 [Endomicrobiia bacterium]GHT68421.1 hypothetical protein AGMMS49556_10120 [Endomicrobiia bacterium]
MHYLINQAASDSKDYKEKFSTYSVKKFRLSLKKLQQVIAAMFDRSCFPDLEDAKKSL